MAETVQQRVAEVLGAHRIECTGIGEVTCRGCRERGWMSWYEFCDHQAQMLADAGLLATPVEPGMPPRSAERAPVATDGRDEGREGL